MNKNLDDHELIKTYIPFIVNTIMKKTEPPKDIKELIQFSQEIAKKVMLRIEPVNMN